MNNKTPLAALGLVVALAGSGSLWHLIAARAVHPELNASLLPAGALLGDADADAEGDEAPPGVDRDYDLSAHQTLSRVILLIRENYVEPDRIKPYDMFLAALDYIEKTVAEVIVDETDAPARVVVSVGSATQTFELGGLDQLWEVTMALRDIFRFLQAHITDPTQRRDIEYAAINGMLSTLDPHSVLLKPENFDEVRLATKGEFGGLGIVIAIRDAALTIMSPIDGTPASRAGLKAKDKIVKIGEESTINMGLDEAVQRLRGKPGSSVVVTVARKTWAEPHKVTLERAIIKIESVTSELLADGIGYVKLKSFQGNTFDDLQEHLKKLAVKQGAPLKGLVLDLRNNPGGLLDAAILVSDRFIERGPLVITVSEGSRKREVKNARPGSNESDYPMAVLLNGGSASASEIVAGALKNHDRAMVIGQQSFGKGSVQVLYDFKDRSALKLTIAQYLTPGDLSIQSTGITPDVQIVPAMIDKDRVHLFVDDDSPREKDLEKHLDQHGSVQVVAPSQVKITHLMPRDDRDGEPGEDELLPHAAFEYDFETELAHDVLHKARSIDRPAALKEALPLFQTRADAQDEVIAARLGELGVDWSRGPLAPPAPAAVAGPAAKSVAEVTLQTAASQAPAVAGSTVTLVGTVTNRGAEALHRVYGVTTSDNPLLKSLEFVFGRLAAGETRRWEVKVKLPPDLSSRADRVRLVLADASGAARGSAASCFVHIAERQRPRFAYSFRVDDREHGNGDGLLAVGEQVALRVQVVNLGPGAAEDATVSLKNLALREVFLDEGRAKLGAMAPGSRQEAVLRFTVHKPLDVVKMRLAIWDGTLGAPVSESLALPVAAAPRPVVEPHWVAAQGTGEVPVYAGADAQMPLSGCLRRGASVRSDAAFAGWYRVAQTAGEAGFVRQADVTVVRGKRGGEAPVRQVAATAPPDIALSLPPLVVEGDTLHLTGTVVDDRRLKDVFVFVNDKKVYFRSLADVPRTEQGVRATIDIPLRLKPGSNGVAIIAREDDDMVARRIFGVFRDEPSGAPLPPPAAAPKGVTAGPPTKGQRPAAPPPATSP